MEMIKPFFIFTLVGKVAQVVEYKPCKVSSQRANDTLNRTKENEDRGQRE